ncbi:MAG: hypothetical protein LQ350_002581 [Teloschistes chrysophthalmus]|nr:MAG: hypothetical protein LQ350_002581 [Niorma chrysophthalma]
MSDIQRYLLKVDDDKAGAEQIAKESTRSKRPDNVALYKNKIRIDCVTEVESKEITLIDLVQSLGEYINDEDPSIRSKAVTYLSNVIVTLPETTLSRHQIQVLCQFLCDRVGDGGAISGLKKLQCLKRFNGEMATMTLRALLEHFQDLMIRPHSQRLQILELLHELMQNHRTALQSLGKEAIVGITDLVSGEKDPRSLMIIFSFLHVIMVEWEIADQAETLFDSVFCYFPITFRPPPDDPYKITAQDLKARLRNCIAASSLFAPYAFPQLIEKLDSTSPNVKKDVLQTLTACASSYGVAAVSNYSVTLWDSLKYEILNVQEEDLAEEALVTLQAIATRLGVGSNSTTQTSSLATYLKPILAESKKQLQEPQHKQAKPIGQILGSLGKSSSSAFLLIVKAIVPALLTLYQDSDSIASQKSLLEVLVQLCNAAVALDQMSDAKLSFSGVEHPLNSFKDRLFELFSQALMGTASEEVTFRIVALQGLLRLCQIGNYLQKSEVGMIVQYLDEIVLTADLGGRDDVRNEAIEALVTISKIKPHLIMDITFPAFMARLPDQASEEQDSYIITLEGLARLSVERSISDTLIRRLLNKLESVLSNPGPATYAQALFSTIDYVLSRRDLSTDPNLSSYHEKIVVSFVSRAALASVDSGPQMLIEPSTLEILGRLVGRIIRALDEHRRKSVALETYTFFLEADAPFHAVLYGQDVPEKRRYTLILSTWILASVGSAASTLYTVADDVDLDRLLNEITRLALLETVPLIRFYLLKQLALLVNRSSAPQGPNDAFRIMQDPLNAAQIVDPSPSLDATPVVFWIAKALVLRLARTEEVLDHVLSLLSSKSHGLASARGFAALLAPDEVLSKENGATIRLLARQRVFSICAPRIAKEFRAAEDLAKPHYLIALSGILKDVPTEVMMAEIDTLLPLLLQSLDLKDQDVKAATIDSLIVVCRESPVAVEGHAKSLTARLAQAGGDERKDTAKVRFNALRCLQIFPGRVKESVLLPLKANIIRGILPSLDDPKRHVRKAAVECRAAWSNLGEPDADD